MMMSSHPFSMVYEHVPLPLEAPLVDAVSQFLVREAADGRRGAAWQLLHRLMKDDPQVMAVVASLDDERLEQYVLEFIALGTWAGKPFVVPALLRSPSARMHLGTLFLPGRGIDPRQTERMLIAALHDSRPALRKVAASILGMLESATTVPALLGALHDPVPSVQLQVVKALGQSGNPAAVSALLNLLPHADEQLDNQIFLSLAQLGPVAVPALIEMSTSSSPWRRWHCIRALGATRDLRALPVLVGALADTSQAVAWMAAKSLPPFGTACVGPVLHLLVSTPTTSWLVETASYVLSNLHSHRLEAYLKPVIQHMHQTDFRLGTNLYAYKALSQLIAAGLLDA